VSYSFLHIVPSIFAGLAFAVVVEAVVAHPGQRCQNRDTRRPVARPLPPHHPSIAPFDMSTCHLTSNRSHHRFRCPKTPPSPRYAGALRAPLHISPYLFQISLRPRTHHFTISQKKAAVEKKGGKKGKDGPKRALSAYMFFSQDWRERIKSENPDAGFGLSPYLAVLVCSSLMVSTRAGEVGKLLGAKWKELDDSEKKVSPAPHHSHRALLTSRALALH
jgi:HMG (high mobility group) box